MSEGLESLEKIKKVKTIIPYRCVQDEYSNEINSVEKELKALKIIKEKQVNIAELMICSSFEDYNEYIYNEYYHFPPAIEEMSLSEEEFDLLMEVLL